MNNREDEHRDTYVEDPPSAPPPGEALPPEVVPADFGVGKTYDEILADLKENFGVVGGTGLYVLFGFPVTSQVGGNNARIYAVRGHLAAANGDIERLKTFMAETSDLNSKWRSGFETRMTWVHAAVMGGQPETLKLLLDSWACATVCRDRTGKTGDYWVQPIHSLGMAHWGDTRPERFRTILDLLILHGANINAMTGQKRTPLGCALWNRRLNNAEALLLAGADPSKDQIFILAFKSICRKYASLARIAYFGRAGYDTALNDPSLLSKPGTESEEAKQVVRIAGLLARAIQDRDIKETLIKTTVTLATDWPQPFLASAAAMIDEDQSLAVPALTAACNQLQEVWSKTRNIAQLEALRGVVSGLIGKLSGDYDPKLVKRAKDLVASVNPLHTRITFIRMESFSCVSLKRLMHMMCAPFESRTIDVDLNMPLWTLEELVRESFPSLRDKHVEFCRAEPITQPYLRYMSLLALEFFDNAMIAVRAVDQPPLPPLETLSDNEVWIRYSMLSSTDEEFRAEGTMVLPKSTLGIELFGKLEAMYIGHRPIRANFNLNGFTTIEPDSSLSDCGVRNGELIMVSSKK